MLTQTPQTAQTSLAEAVAPSRSRVLPLIAAGAVAVTIALVILLMRTSGSTTPQARASLGRGPDVVLARAKTVLSAHAKIGGGTLVAQDADLNRVALSDTADATSFTASFTPTDRHYWRVFVGHATDASKSGSTGCHESASVVSCSTDQTPGGGTLVTSVIAAKAATDLGPDKFVLVDVSTLKESDRPQLRVQRDVREFRANGTVVSATEFVTGPQSMDFDQAFDSPVVDLHDLATDDSLVAP